MEEILIFWTLTATNQPLTITHPPSPGPIRDRSNQVLKSSNSLLDACPHYIHCSNGSFQCRCSSNLPWFKSFQPVLLPALNDSGSVSGSTFLESGHQIYLNVAQQGRGGYAEHGQSGKCGLHFPPLYVLACVSAPGSTRCRGEVSGKHASQPVHDRTQIHVAEQLPEKRDFLLSWTRIKGLEVKDGESLCVLVLVQ